MVKIIADLLNIYVQFPTTSEEFRVAAENFQIIRTEKPFPHTVGCVDCTHINISCPKTNSSSYYNRKGTHSIVLQAVCDSKSRFIDVFFGWPGRSHDAAIWKNSPLGRKLENKEICLSDYHLLGDSVLNPVNIFYF